MDYLFTWKSEHWDHKKLLEFVNQFKSLGIASEDWTCAAHKQVRPGDRAYLLRQGAGTRRGIFGRGRVVSVARPREPISPRGGAWAVDLSFDEHRGDALCDPEKHLLVTWDELLGIAPKTTWQIRASGASLAEDAARQLDEIIDSLGFAMWTHQTDPEEAVIDVAEQIRSRASGQGFFMPPKVRKAIEDHAVGIAKGHYEGQGYKVEVQGKPFDLLCTRDDHQVFVEVKGTQTSGEEVLLTPNEVRFARENKIEMVLFIVHSVSVDKNADPPHVYGGNIRVFEPWDIDNGELEALGYTFKIEKS
ncbi:MAG TPA: DUF3883 domain-containing protein [Candidatus Dormibacteraeota bacterium]|jgi:hypothetical protein|nr:DUF3883 domain-containing protein [Candidatus Dormibacteraeota bacterium]